MPTSSPRLSHAANRNTLLGSPSQPCQHYNDQNALPKIESNFSSDSSTFGNASLHEGITPHSATTAPSGIWNGARPSLAKCLSPDVDLYGPLNVMEYQSMDNMSTYHDHGLHTLQISSSLTEEDVEEIIREPANLTTWMVPLSSPTQSDSSSSSDSSWCDNITPQIILNPSFHPYSQERLLMRFEAETCGILSIKNGPSENPWKMILWPLATTEPALHHAISAMTAFHASKEDRNLRNVGVQHMTRSVQQLSHGIQTMRIDTALSTTLVLAFCESWDLLISTGMKHLLGAKKLIWQLLENRLPNTFPQQDMECVGFLVKTWVYMDVIARLTSLEHDDSEDFDILYNPICQYSMQGRGMDPLMGCASGMFPIIGRVGNLIRKVRQTRENSYKFIEEATVLKSRLEKWSAPRVFEEPQDISTDVEQALRTAEAYRSATLLYLYQAVPEISLNSATDKIACLAKEVLINLANVPVTSGAVIIHIFPLLAAGCEAVEPEPRAFVEERWLAMMKRMKIGNIDKCLEIVKDVWERRDYHNAERLRNNAFLPKSNMQAREIADLISRRNIGAGDDLCDHETVLESVSGITRRSVLRRESSAIEEKLEFDLTVRGRRHWAGVMKDKDWEG